MIMMKVATTIKISYTESCLRCSIPVNRISLISMIQDVNMDWIAYAVLGAFLGFDVKWDGLCSSINNSAVFDSGVWRLSLRAGRY
jgi:hypothetical protein